MGNGGWGEASSLRHFSASESHGGDAGLVSEPQELRQISPAVPEGRGGGDRRGHAKGARRHGELKREGHGCQTPTWREGGGVGGGGGALKGLGQYLSPEPFFARIAPTSFEI